MAEQGPGGFWWTAKQKVHTLGASKKEKPYHESEPAGTDSAGLCQ